MFHNLKSQAIVVALAGFTLALPATTSTTTLKPSLTSTTNPSVTTWCALLELGPKITAITPGTAVTGLQLTNKNRSGQATLTSSGYGTAISYANGGLGFFDNCHEWWLNIGTSTYSWKPLSFGFDHEASFNWIVSSGNILTASGTTSYPTTSWFLACQEAGSWVLYLQTGSQQPVGETCVLTQLQIGGSSSTVITSNPTTTTSKPPTTTLKTSTTTTASV
ncbi:hypothetical protein FRC04_010707 [Tulasnella sp. 424]|nr:hypothetical protein FRC04_010707 [Tulasnella sp. 424]KAG8972363.1 hypothetical protein FRC05_010074 [Tulasnella sp. 425]